MVKAAKRTEVNAYVARFVYPDDIETLADMFEARDMPDFDLILNEQPVDWAMPKSCLVGDVVFFQLGLRSPANLRKAIRQARENGVEGAALQYLIDTIDDVDSRAGSLVAVGRVSDRPFAGSGGPAAHFKGRVFAPISDLTSFDTPVLATGISPLTRLPAFASAGPVTHRMFSSDASYQATLDFIDKTTGLPSWLRRTYVGEAVDPTAPGSWAARIARSNTGWFSEDHLRLGFAGPFAQAISDGRKVDEEVPITDLVGVRKSGIVDYVVRIGRIPVPLEAKLSHTAERDFLRQIRKYTGPALARSERYDHGVVLAIDSSGIYVLVKGQWLGSGNGDPYLPRRDLSLDAIKQLRHELRRLIDDDVG